MRSRHTTENVLEFKPRFQNVAEALGRIADTEYVHVRVDLGVLKPKNFIALVLLISQKSFLFLCSSRCNVISQSQPSCPICHTRFDVDVRSTLGNSAQFNSNKTVADQVGASSGYLFCACMIWLCLIQIYLPSRALKSSLRRKKLSMICCYCPSCG